MAVIFPEVAFAGMVTLTCVLLTKVVALALPPLKATVVPETKFAPLMVNNCPIYPVLVVAPPVIPVMVGVVE